MDIKKIRTKIDKLDKEMVRVISKRMKIIPYVAKYKKENYLPRYQSKREREVIKNVRDSAKKFSINPNLAEKIIKLIIKDAHRIEREILGK